MTKREFLKELRSRLGQLNDVERDQVLLYWSEAIEDRLESGMSEQEIFAELESPDTIALRILSELHQNGAAAQPVPPSHSCCDDDADDEDEDYDAGDQDADDDFRMNIHIPEFHIPEINIPDIKIPEIPPIPEIHIPEIHIPERKTKGWYFGFGPQGVGFRTDDEEFKRRKLTAKPESIRELRILDHNNSVDIEPADGDQLVICWTQSKYHQYEVSGENGVLSLTHQQPGMLERMFNASRREKVVVKIPDGFAGLIDVTTSNASISAEELKLEDGLKLTTSNASLKLERVDAAQIISTTCNASIKGEKLRAQEMSLRTSNAKLMLEQAAAPVMDLHTSNGKLELQALRAHTLVAVTSNGSLVVEDVDAQELSLKTSNGNISGVLAGSALEYSIESGTSNGKNSIPNRAGGSKTLKAKTSNGNIKLSFAED